MIFMESVISTLDMHKLQSDSTLGEEILLPKTVKQNAVFAG